MLSAESLTKIDVEIAKYPADKKRSAVIGALRIAQQEKGWLSHELIEYIAHYLSIPSVAAYEVSTFYKMYNLRPTGKYKLTLCTCLPCALQGSMDAAAHLKKKLDIEFGQTTPDGKFTLLESECMGACGDAPVILINNHKLCAYMTAAAIDQKLAELE